MLISLTATHCRLTSGCQSVTRRLTYFDRRHTLYVVEEAYVKKIVVTETCVVTGVERISKFNALEKNRKGFFMMYKKNFNKVSLELTHEGSLSALALMNYLFGHVEMNKNTLVTSLTLLAKEMRCSRNTVIKALKRLVLGQVVHVEDLAGTVHIRITLNPHISFEGSGECANEVLTTWERRLNVTLEPRKF